VNTRYRDEIDDDYQATGEREINLNAATILGIFFLLALICGVFFAFGYTMGRKSAPSPSAETLAAPTPAPPVTSTPKPSPGTHSVVVDATTPIAPSATPDATERESQGALATTQVAQPSPASIQLPSDQNATTATPRSTPAQRHPAAASPPPAPSPAHQNTTGPAAAFMVQIAAVSHKEDADVLQTALERRGYHIIVTHVPQDKLIHVQVGPFSNRKDADAMRQRLFNDGYNAIVK
jgi:DedD protein